jgi:hypothetical protein
MISRRSNREEIQNEKEITDTRGGPGFPVKKRRLSRKNVSLIFEGK